MSLRRCKSNGKDVVRFTKRELTEEGYLQAPAIIARTGIQEYTAVELGLEASDKIIRLYRSPAEVFSQAALDSFEAKPITLFHPEKGVSASNWRGTAVGDFHNVRKETDDLVHADLIVRDEDTVREVAFGLKELSCGYDFDLDLTPGTTPEGQAYDGLQKNIRGNHLAIVYRGRCGPECRIGDGAGTGVGDCGCNHTERNQNMATITRIIDGITLAFADDTQASVIEKVVKDANARTATAETRATTAESARDVAIAGETKAKDEAAKAAAAAEEAKTKLVADHAAAIVAKDKEIADLKAKQITDAQIEALAAERAKVVADALVLVPEFKAEGKTLHAIRSEVLGVVVTKDEAAKAVITAALDGVELAKADETTVRKTFAIVMARPKTGAGDGAGAGSAGGKSEEDKRRDAEMANGGRGGAPSAQASGRDRMMERMKNGGKDPQTNRAAQ
jgi:uncharacterized protein